VVEVLVFPVVYIFARHVQPGRPLLTGSREDQPWQGVGGNEALYTMRLPVF
jgi:hypothetical protein